MGSGGDSGGERVVDAMWRELQKGDFLVSKRTEGTDRMETSRKEEGRKES